MDSNHTRPFTDLECTNTPNFSKISECKAELPLFQEGWNETMVLRGESTKVDQIWTGYRMIINTRRSSFIFRHTAPVQYQITSKVTAFENQGKILHFLTHAKIGEGGKLSESIFRVKPRTYHWYTFDGVPLGQLVDLEVHWKKVITAK